MIRNDHVIPFIHQYINYRYTSLDGITDQLHYCHINEPILTSQTLFLIVIKSQTHSWLTYLLNNSFIIHFNPTVI